MTALLLFIIILIIVPKVASMLWGAIKLTFKGALCIAILLLVIASARQIAHHIGAQIDAYRTAHADVSAEVKAPTSQVKTPTYVVSVGSSTQDFAGYKAAYEQHFNVKLTDAQFQAQLNEAGIR